MNSQLHSNLSTSISKGGNSLPTIGITRFHTKRLREVYRSAGWPFQDTVEIELIAAGLLERTSEPSGREKVRVTANGIACLAQSIQKNRQNSSPHELLVDRIAQTMLRDGRIVWTSLSLRAKLPSEPETAALCS